MRMSRACSGMLSSENDDFKFLKTVKNIKAQASCAPEFQGLWNCFISPNKFVNDQKHECYKSCKRDVLYNFRNIDTGTFSFKSIKVAV